MSSKSIEYVYKLIDQYSAVIKRMSSATKAFENDMAKAKKEAAAMSSSISNGFKTAATVGVAALGAGLAYVIKKASDFENSLVSFTTLLGGNSDAAKKLVGDLQELGARTPFEFKDLADASSMLMGFGAATEKDVIPKLSMLGDLAQGNKEKLHGIALAFGQIKAQGKANLQDINQLINNQVPILQQLAKQWGVTVGQAREMVHVKGTAEEIEKAMKAMTSEGGLFYQGMLRASTTFTGLFSTFMDSISMTAAGLGESLLPVIKMFLIKITEISSKLLAWVNRNKELIQVKVAVYIRNIVIVFQILWAILKVVFPILKAFAPMILTLIAVFKAYSIIMMIVNAIMYANPINLLVLGIALLIGAIVMLIVHWNSIKSAMLGGWETIKSALLTGASAIGDFFIFIWDKIKDGFIMAFDVVKKIFFTFADLILTVYGSIAKVILGLVSKIGSAIGINTDGIEDMIKGISDVQAGVRKESFFGGIGEDKNKELKMNGKEKAQVNVKTDVSVYTENGMKVTPFEKRNNLGYQMSGSYGK